MALSLFAGKGPGTVRHKWLVVHAESAARAIGKRKR
jgi:hypothetical protein